MYETEDYKRKDKKRMKEVLASTKKITKSELSGMIRSITKEIMREEIVNYLRAEDVMRGAIAEEFQKYVGTRAFEFKLEEIIRSDIQRIRRLLEDAALDVVVEAKKKKRRASPGAGMKTRRVRL